MSRGSVSLPLSGLRGRTGGMIPETAKPSDENGNIQRQSFINHNHSYSSKALFLIQTTFLLSFNRTLAKDYGTGWPISAILKVWGFLLFYGRKKVR